MQFNEDVIDEGYFVSAYGDGEVVVAGRTLSNSFIISADTLNDDWAPDDVNALRHEHVAEILALGPELVLIGTGETLRFPAIEHYACLIEANIGVEIMDSAAACRTYNILLQDGRGVVAGIIL